MYNLLSLTIHITRAGDTTVLLDVSASLYALVLEGTLIFDDLAEGPLHLQVATCCGMAGSTSFPACLLNSLVLACSS